MIDYMRLTPHTRTKYAYIRDSFAYILHKDFIFNYQTSDFHINIYNS